MMLMPRLGLSVTVYEDSDFSNPVMMILLAFVGKIRPAIYLALTWLQHSNNLQLPS